MSTNTSHLISCFFMQKVMGKFKKGLPCIMNREIKSSWAEVAAPCNLLHEQMCFLIISRLRDFKIYCSYWGNHWTIYSATSFLEKCRKVVREIWFEKSGWLEKKVVLYHKSKYFLVGEKWLTRKKKSEFEEPLF